ncbi:MAG: VWA domain-containing protein [Gammaproteobacteria bacterium]|nr:VWA domain-containing protein [Gammaproteobacteria bacterium]
MEQIHLKVVQPGSAEVIEHPLSLDAGVSECSMVLRTFPGTSGLHLLFLQDGNAKLRVNIPTHGEESVSIRVVQDKERELHVYASGGNTVILPVKRDYCPAGLIPPPSSEQALDVVLIVDGTTRFWEKTKTGRTAKLLLDDEQAWKAHVELFGDFVETLAKGISECRYAVIAFGDQAPPNVRAPELKPAYLLWPERDSERFLQPLELARMKSALLNVPSTSGGDFVDALADALEACSRLRWQSNARKLVVVIGDSPGHSIIHPVRGGGDVCVRRMDMETAAMQLHHLGIEVMTIYHAPPPDVKKEFLGFQKELLDYTKQQYEQLASLPELAFSAFAFDAAKASDVFCGRTQPIGRGTAFGQLV